MGNKSKSFFDSLSNNVNVLWGGGSSGDSGDLGLLSGQKPWTPPNTNPADDGDPNYNPYGGGWGYGGGGSSGPTDNDRKAAGNLGAIVGYNADTLRDKFDQTMDTFDLADEQNKNLKDNNIAVAKASAGSDWFRQINKLQSTVHGLTDRAGNARRGSFLYDLNDLVAHADDDIDSTTLDEMRQNTNSILQSYFEALAQNNVNRQEAAMDTESGLRELFADYVAQVNNIHPDLAEDMIDAKNHDLNGVDWLDTNFFDKHKVEALKPERQGLYRPDQANNQARDEKNLDKEWGYNTASSAVRSYWDRMNRGYDQRTRQA